MAKHSLVAVGGSGQSAAIAYLRLAIMSGVNGSDLPNIYVIDADIKDRTGADAKPSLYSSLKQLFEKLTQGVAQNERPKFALVYPYANSHGDLPSETTFADYILSQGGDKKETRYVIDSLFNKRTQITKKHELSEQEVPLSRGFMARPNVGATTFFDKLHQDYHKLEHGLQRLKQTVIGANGQEHVIVVVGSSFGGTGSGAAPSLAQQLARWANINHITPKIGLFMTLPWFNPNAARSNVDTAPTHGSSDIQNRNMSGGLHYYNSSKTFEKIDVFVANYAGQVHSRNDDSNSEQPEYEHVFNLLLAAQIQNYFINRITTDKFNHSGAYTFYLPQRDLRFNADDSALLAFAIDEKVKQDLKLWAHEAQALRLALRYSANYMTKDFKPNRSDKRSIPKCLFELAFKVAEQDGRPQMIVTEKKFLGLSSEKKPHAEIYQNIAKKLYEREQQLADSIAWLNRLKDNSPELSIDDASINKNPDSLFSDFAALNVYKNDDIEIASIRLFEEALNVNINQNIIQDFETRTTHGQDAVTAAAVQIEAELRRIIRLRSFQPRLHDENPTAGAGQSGEIAKVFIPLDVGGTPVSRYLQKINLAQMVDDGKDWQGQVVRVWDKSHPASLNGLLHASVPSPWGAALLEQWLQEQAVGSKDKQLVEQVSKRLEAILWSIFSKRLIVKQVKARHNESMIDSVLQVREVETGATFEQCDWFSIAVNPTNNQVIAANYPTVGWFTAPSLRHLEWWEGRNEFFEEFLKLPTELVNDSEAMKPLRYEARLVKRFSAWLKELLEKHGDDASRSATSSWYPIVKHIYTQLENNLSSETIALDVQQADEGEAFILSMTNGYCEVVPVLRVEKARQEIIQNAQSHHLLVLEDIVNREVKHQIPHSPLSSSNRGTAQLLESSAPFKDSEGQDCMKLTYQLDLPEGQFIENYTAKIVRLRVQQVIFPNFKAEDWKLYFAGATPTENEALDNVKNPAFAYRLYEVDEQGNKSQVRYLQDSEAKSFIEPLYFDRNYELYGRPDILVLLQYSKDQYGHMSYQEAGIFNIALEAVDSERKSTFKLALDFGTSHSCVVALDASDRVLRNIDFTRLDAPYDLLYKVITTPSGDKYLFDEFNFISSFAAKQEQAKSLDRNVLPSEFRFNRRLNREEPLKNIDNGIRYLTILPMRFNKDSAERTIKDNGAIGDYKWGATKQTSSLTGTIYEGEQVKLSAQYIKQILRIALAFLRQQGYRNLTTFRATYPEAFTTDHINGYAKELERAFSQLIQETGIIVHQEINSTALLELKDVIQGEKTVLNTDVDIDSHGLVSEAMGALETAKAKEGYALAEKQLQIVLDMGGGSTDVAVFLQKDKLNLTEPVDLPYQLTDSLRYAGHDVLHILSTPNIIQRLDEKFKSAEQQKRIGVLKIAMRNQQQVEQLKLDLVGDKFDNEKRNAQDFFEGLFEYTRQLILSYQALIQPYSEKPLSVGIVLLGNGWRLGSLIYESTDVEPIKGLIKTMQDYLNKNLVNLGELSVLFPVSSDVSVKESIAYGSLLYNPRLAEQMGNKDNAKFSFIGTNTLNYPRNIQGEKFLGQLSDKQRKEFGKVIEVETLTDFPKDSNFVERIQLVKGWENQNALHLTKLELNKRLKELWLSKEKQLLISPMRDFLETVWKNKVLLADEL